ncbi:MAG: hypothetical protein RSG77_18340 [Hafnia sp.]
MLEIMIGAIITAAVLKYKPKLIYVLGTFGACTLAYRIYTNEYMYENINYLVGGFFLFFAYKIYTMIVLPLRGKWPEFKEYYVVRGKVVDSDTTTHFSSTTTVSQGVFGNLNADTTHTITDHDTLTVKQRDGSIAYARGVDLKRMAKVGDEVIFGGQNGKKHYVFFNKTKDQIIGDRVQGTVGIFFMSLLNAIPPIGMLLSCIPYVFGSKVMQSVLAIKAMYSTNSMEFERKHVRFQFLYLVALPLAAIYLIGRDNMETLVTVGLIIPLVLSLVHLQLWRKDYERFCNFIIDKVVEKSRET